ncbi:MAG: ImmA/IrrE family metallo-endopeptidase [Methanobrevibacter wolinii]|nr:ImmA/IrrE family metallo-endopeptidase [Methanobrevibacter wolinii]
MKSLIELNALAVELRDELNISPYSSIDLFNIIPSCFTSATIIFYPMSDYTSGMCIRNGDESIVGINSSTSLGRQRFTLGHEMYHLLYDENFSDELRVCNFDDETDSELEAENFASFLIMPYEGLKKHMKIHNIKKWTLDDAIVCEQYFQISHQALLYRLLQHKFVNQEEYDKLLNVKITHEAKLRGFDKSIYEKTNCTRHVVGNYVRLVEKAYHSHLISKDKRNSMLLDGFQDEIVYKYEG